MIFALNSANAYYKLICHDNIITVTEIADVMSKQYPHRYFI